MRLWGALPFTWCGNLSLQCVGARVSIVEVDARHLGRARWDASLLVEAVGQAVGDGSGKGGSLAGLDFLAMARRRPGLVPLREGLELASFRLDPPGADGAARLHVAAPDRLGLLAGLLARVVACGLRPRELCVRTPGGRAEDWVSLESDGGLPPTASSLAALEAALRTG